MLLKIISQLSIVLFASPGMLAPPTQIPANPFSPVSVVSQPGENILTEFEAAEKDKQDFVASSDVVNVSFVYSKFSATTPEEIAAVKAEAERVRLQEEAKKAAEEARNSRVTLSSYSGLSGSWGNLGCLTYCWPLTGFYSDFENNGFRTGSRPNHEGLDMLADAGTPIYSVADGIVRVSSESYYGYGVGVVVDYVIDGQPVSMTYGHMTYGSRQVEVGQTVKAGQVLGLVGSTGRSTANHLHLEISVNGSLVDPHPWLIEHAGAL